MIVGFQTRKGMLNHSMSFLLYTFSMLRIFKQHWLEISVSILFALALFTGLQYSTKGKFADPDGFYHAKSSQKIAAGELDDRFPWLYFTTWKEDYANQHYLYHWLLVPFNTIETLQISIIVFGLVFVGSFLAVMFQYKLALKPFWILLLLASSVDFLFRINLVKANTISLALLCLIVILIHRHHFKQTTYSLFGIGLVSGLFVWTYGGFIFLPVLLGTYALSVIASKRSFDFVTIKKAFAPLAFSLIGIALGVVLHPQSHHLFSLMFDQLFRTGLGAGSVVPAGNEWLPFNIEWFFESNILILITWLLSLTLFARAIFRDWKNFTSERNSTLIIWLQITALGLVALTLWHRRFVEYWIPFAVLASAITFQSYIENLEWKKVKVVLRYWQLKVAGVLLIIFIIGISGYNIERVYRSLADGEPADNYEAAAMWLKENSDHGDIVVNTQWDQFPQLFYYNDRNYYIVGLDPTFMHIHDPEKYWMWRKIADDNPKDWESIEDLYNILADGLNSSYLYIDINRNPDISEYIDKNDQKSQFFTKSFEENGVVIYKY